MKFSLKAAFLVTILTAASSTRAQTPQPSAQDIARWQQLDVIVQHEEAGAAEPDYIEHHTDRVTKVLETCGTDEKALLRSDALIAAFQEGRDMESDGKGKAAVQQFLISRIDEIDQGYIRIDGQLKHVQLMPDPKWPDHMNSLKTRAIYFPEMALGRMLAENCKMFLKDEIGNGFSRDWFLTYVHSRMNALHIPLAPPPAPAARAQHRGQHSNAQTHRTTNNSLNP